jgi:hypothetical protein
VIIGVPHELPWPQREAQSFQSKGDRSSCSTCEIIGKFTGDFWELTPQVEAIYIEHLIREHDIQP